MKLNFDCRKCFSGPGQHYMDLGSMDNKQRQTLMWQQGQYMSDSGIHSGLTTHGPPSVSSKHGLDEMETGNEMDTTQMMFDFDQGFNQGFTQEQVDGDYSIILYCVITVTLSVSSTDLTNVDLNHRWTVF